MFRLLFPFSFVLFCSFLLLTASEKTVDTYDPLAKALESKGQISNYEATVPPQCYTKTEGKANVCWTCHNASVYPNQMHDVELQEEYAFSDQAMSNHWTNLFLEQTTALESFTDEEVLAYVRGDNYVPLCAALEARTDFPGYKPDLDFEKGFDDQGWAQDGSQWRAFKYKPFPGVFWPTNGNTDDVMIRLPEKFRTLGGLPNQGIYKINLAVVEASIAAGPEADMGKGWYYATEALDETLIDTDLNGDGKIATAKNFQGLPKTFFGDAAFVVVKRYIYPKGTEFLHSVRYLDPEAPGMLSRRMKELRYMKKVAFLDTWALNQKYEDEYNEKEEGTLPIFAGDPIVGMRNGFGWQLQGYIEDAEGRLRLQTHEEHQACMGCHSAVGVTVDQTFSLARKIPGADGWGYQSIVGIKDVPQQGHQEGEIATYLKRAGGGDPFRANEEMIARFFNEKGELREDLLAQAAPGGDKDITALILPSHGRALDLNRAYMNLVKRQNFERGRDVVIKRIENIHQHIENGSTDLAPAGLVFGDGRAWLRWDHRP